MSRRRVDKQGAFRHVAKFDPSRPYDALPPLPPKADIETRAILKACIDARAAVAALRQAGALIPNQGVLINTIPLLEAQASSEIENIVTTTDALFKYSQLDPENADPATKEALRYRTALRLGVESLKAKPLSTSTAVSVCSTIKGPEMAIRRVPGTSSPTRRKTRLSTPRRWARHCCGKNSPTGSVSSTTRPKSIRLCAWPLRTTNLRLSTRSRTETGARAGY